MSPMTGSCGHLRDMLDRVADVADLDESIPELLPSFPPRSRLARSWSTMGFDWSQIRDVF